MTDASRHDSRQESIGDASSGTVNPADVMPKGNAPAPGAIESQGPAKPMERLKAVYPLYAFDGQGALSEEGVKLAAAMSMETVDLPPWAALDEQGRFVNPTLEGIAIAETAASLPDPTAAPGASGVPKDWEEVVTDLDRDLEFAG